MSSHRVHVYVEGRRVDSYVYGRICETVLGASSPKTFQIVRADQLNAGLGGGKKVVLDEYQDLSSRGLLKSSRYTTVFFLDKDLDDIERTKVNSQHIRYTDTYDIEGLVYRNGDIADAVGATLSMDRRTIQAHLGNSEDWCNTASLNWKEWVVLCLIARRLNARTAANYGNLSTVNSPFHETHQRSLAKTAHQLLLSSSGSTSATFNKIRTNVRHQVNRLVRAGRLDCVFKGKWYAQILDSEIQSGFASEYAGAPAFGDRVTSCLMQNLDYTSDWAKPYRETISSLTSKLST